MRTTGFLTHAAVLAALAALPPNLGAAETPDRGSTLSAALGGALGDGMSDAGGIGHGRLGPAAGSRPGRSESYRRQVARNLELDQPGATVGRPGNELVARSGTLPTYASSSSSAGSRRL
jgi:hypothetical protein